MSIKGHLYKAAQCNPILIDKPINNAKLSIPELNIDEVMTDKKGKFDFQKHIISIAKTVELLITTNNEEIYKSISIYEDDLKIIIGCDNYAEGS